MRRISNYRWIGQVAVGDACDNIGVDALDVAALMPRMHQNVDLCTAMDQLLAQLPSKARGSTRNKNGRS